MPPLPDKEIFEKTSAWLESFVIELNICPFAAHVVKQQTLLIEVKRPSNLKQALAALMSTIARMDKELAIETALLVLPESFDTFDDYLELIDLAETLLFTEGYEGTYQIASFHPGYCFADTTMDDVANYTNRSPYPMVHLLRESSVEKAIDYYGDTSNIPDNNIAKMHQLGRKNILTLLGNICPSLPPNAE